MKVKLMFTLLLLTVIAFAGVQQTMARQAYMDAYNTTFNNASCGVCHTNPVGGGSLNSYGTSFSNQPDYVTYPSAALNTIGPATATTTGTPTATATVAGTATMTATPDDNDDVTPTITATRIPTGIPTGMPTATQTVPGFGYVIFLIGLLTGYVLLKQRNK